MSNLPRFRATAVQALIDLWLAKADKDWHQGHDDVDDGVWSYQHEANGRAKARREDAAELAALLLGEGQEQDGATMIAAERLRQVRMEDWTPAHDDTHRNGEMARAAACYALQHTRVSGRAIRWPWSRDWWKPKTPIRNLIRAGALIAAEIDRLQRADPAALREGQEPDWIGKCPKCNRTVLNHGDLCSQCAGLREEQEPPFACKAKAATDPPQDCDWPFCGCDPAAERVIDAVEESGRYAPAGLREGPPAPQPVCTCRHDSGMSTVCDVHYPAPHGHAGEAPATEPVKCKTCSGSGFVAYWDGSAYAGEGCPDCPDYPSLAASQAGTAPRADVLRLASEFDDVLGRVQMYGAADRVRDQWRRLKDALLATQGAVPPQEP